MILDFRKFYIFLVLALYFTSSVMAQLNTKPLITFDKYHTVAEFETYLETAAQRYPKLTKLIEIGKSRAGHRILAIEITNPDTGPAYEKPAFYNDGNIHGNELSAGEAALCFINQLLTRYGHDQEITTLVDAYVFYNVPLVNPDGRAVSTTTPNGQRRNLRPVDEDKDGAVDEDGPEDIDGDGFILRMRVIDPKGRWKMSPQDPRVMLRRTAEDKEGIFFQVYTEGIDNDGDDCYNEDRAGGIDLNRNFPSNWHPAQYASGPFPLSEPESHALIAYITNRPNIAAIHTYHTRGGMILRFPTLANQDWEFPQSDLEEYKLIADDGIKFTEYTHYAYEKKSIIDRMKPGHGVFNDWGSNVFGVFAITTEIWRRNPDHSETARLVWNDKTQKGSFFVAWHEFTHPQLGKVELGGWKHWIAGSPPEPLLATELERNNRWLLSFAKKLPLLAIASSEVSPISGTSDCYSIEAAVANMGWMPTATAHAANILKIAKPIRVKVELTNAELLKGETSYSLGVLPGTKNEKPIKKHLQWQVRILDRNKPAAYEIIVKSEKAGTVRKYWEFGNIPDR